MSLQRYNVLLYPYSGFDYRIMQKKKGRGTMKAIEFRGKNKDSNDWHYGGYTKPIDSDYVIIWDGYWVGHEEGRDFGYQCRPDTVGQFTGAFDINGKKIFEGDIIKKALREDDNRKFLVQWQDECARFIAVTIPLEKGPSEKRYLWYVGDELSKDGIVIGNIHDNPEILREED